MDNIGDLQWTGVFTLNVHKGTLNQLWAATNKSAESGKHYDPIAKEVSGSKYAQDFELGKKLWDFTEAEINKLSL